MGCRRPASIPTSKTCAWFATRGAVAGGGRTTTSVRWSAMAMLVRVTMDAVGPIAAAGDAAGKALLAGRRFCRPFLRRGRSGGRFGQRLVLLLGPGDVIGHRR